MKRYIHYGSDKFDPERFMPVDDSYFDNYNPIMDINKPHHGVGLWASPVSCYISWKEWCENEDFHTERLQSHFEFTLKPEAKVLTIKCLNDIEPYTNTIAALKSHDYKGIITPWDYKRLAIDFKAIFDKFDAMELVHSPKTYMELHDGLFNAWDVDSIIIWNKEVISV